MDSNPSEHRLSLADALRLAGQPAKSRSSVPFYLACGFTPLHLTTFLKAHSRIRFPEAHVSVQTGLFDDLAGTIERLPASVPAAIVIEWPDLDPRLGLRGSAGWTTDAVEAIPGDMDSRLGRLHQGITKAAERSLIVVAGPTLPLAPLGHTGPAQDTALELRMRALVDNFLAQQASSANVRIVSQQQLALASPAGSRLDAAMTLATGYPYTLAHSDALARILIAVMFPREPMKGLITDLDDTLWHGILGEIGVEKIGWSLETNAQVHGIYQQFLAALAERGVLLAVASKNNPELVERALSRSDLFCRASSFFPIEISWGPKSKSVARILDAWNINPADVVFIDDSPLELAEVGAIFPQMTCLAFPRGDAQAVWDLLQRLRDLFGRQKLQSEDQIRSKSLRTARDVNITPSSAEEFLASLNAVLTLDFNKDAQNTRAFELVNKTNQFNLNGRRWSDYEWREMLENPEQLLLTVSYTDRFGPLGRIAVIVATTDAARLRIHTWVMSCRAFSRRIEHAVVSKLMELASAETVVLEFQETERNLPVRQFIEETLGISKPANPVSCGVSDIKRNLPMLYHKISVTGREGATSRENAASMLK